MSEKPWEHYFDSSFYELQIPSGVKTNQDLEAHYKTYGRSRKIAINPLFNTKYYLTFNSLESEDDVFEHYEKNDSNPFIHPLFDEAHYLKQTHLSSRPLERSLLFHFIKEGWKNSISPSPYFDVEYYIKQNPDVRKSNLPPLLHYILNGEKESRSPHPNISASKLESKNYSNELISQYTKLGCYAIEKKFGNVYLFENLKNSVAKNNAFKRSVEGVHNLLERYSASFDEDYYLRQYVDVAEHKVDPFFHYMTNGFKEGRNPHPMFDTPFFRNLYTINNKNIDAFMLYLSHTDKHLTPHAFVHTNYFLKEIQKKNETINYTLLEYFDQDKSEDKIYPSPLFDIDYYSKTYEASKNQNLDPFLHFINIGVYENKLPSEIHDYKRYLWENPDVALRQINPILHYAKHGRFERRALYKKNEATINRPNLSSHASHIDKTQAITVWLDTESKEILDQLNNLDLKINLVTTNKKATPRKQIEELLQKSKGSNLIYRHAPAGKLNTILSLSDFIISAHTKLCHLLVENPHVGLMGPLRYFNRISDIYNRDDTAYRYYINTFQNEDDWGIFNSAYYAFNPLVLESLLKSEIINQAHVEAIEYKDELFNIHFKIDIVDLLIHKETFSNDLNIALYSNTHLENNNIDFLLVNAKHAKDYALDYPGRSALVEKKLNDYYNAIDNNKVFDKDYYLRHNKSFIDIQDPIVHYLRYGAFMNYDPSSTFDNAVYWKTYPEEAILNPLAHHISQPDRCFSFPKENTPEQELLIKQSENLIKDEFYSNHVEIKDLKLKSKEHYFKIGWKYHLEPNSHLTGHLYYSKLKNGKDINYNPLLHHSILNPKLEKKKRFFSSFFNKESQGVKLKANFRRGILFAAFNKNDKIPDSTLKYLKELQNHGDIYYLTDNKMPSQEMERLKPIVKEAYACRHASYDFGSYKRLMVNILGWKKILEYDEIMWVNDSCFLLNSLSPLFDKMENQSLDFWGVQATKGMYKTRHLEENKFQKKISTDKIFKLFNKSFKKRPNFDFHIGSYFIGFRKSVLEDEDFQNFVENIQKETTKEHIIIKYEFGLTKLLLEKSYKCRTFLDHIYPFHPIYGLQYFEILKEGFPLLKKYLLTKNHYRIHHLNEWKTKLKDYTSETNLELIDSEIQYLENYESSYNNQHYPVVAMEPEAFELADLEIEKEDNWWVFPVCGFNHTLSGNTRAVFQAVKDNPDIKKIVLCRSQKPVLEGVNVHILPLRSEESNYYLLRSKVIFLKHTIYRNVHYNLDASNRLIINLWHGIPLKRIGTASLDQQNNLDFFDIENSKYKAVIASSETDAINMKNSFLPLGDESIWQTGLPRIDFILCEEDKLPADYKAELEQLRRLKKEKKLIAYVPTFRNAQEMYDFSLEKKVSLMELLESNNAILGFREHMASKVSYMGQFSQYEIIDLSGAKIKHIEMIYRVADVLITDYSSAYIDYILLNKPVISFAYDLEHYKENERGFFYELEDVFPGYICRDFNDLQKAIQEVLKFDPSNDPFSKKRAEVIKLLFKYVDSDNAKRVINKIKIELNLK